MDENIITVKNLTKKFDGFTAVNNISFDVKKGEIFAFLGPNGAGKTTSIKMLTTLLKPTSGEILLDGHNPVTDQAGARKTFGIVFQDPSLDDELTAYENMIYHAILYQVNKKVAAERTRELMTLVSLWNRKDELVKNFSGGMRRRLEIARGLLHHPKIFFLDEPTLGLDPQTRNLIWDYIKDLNKKEGITVFFTTHYMEEAAKIAQRISIIDGGKIIETGTVNEILKKAKKDNLEDAFLELTGHEIREQEATATDTMRMGHSVWTGGRH